MGTPWKFQSLPSSESQESKSTLDDSHVIAAKFQYFVCITRFFWCPRCPPKKYEKSSPVPFVPLISTRFRMVELIRLFTVVGVFTAVIWVEQSLEGFFQGHMERLEWNSQKFTTKETWHHSSWGHGRYKASNGICRSCKRTVSQIWKWMISKERLNIPIQRGFSMTDNENPSAWISTPEGVFLQTFWDLSWNVWLWGPSPKVHALWHHWVSFCRVIGHLQSWFHGGRALLAFDCALVQMMTQRAGKPLMEKRGPFTEFLDRLSNRPPSKSPEKLFYVRR